MIENEKPYPEYKDSGLPWVGPVPSHWDLIPNRGLMKRKKVLVGERHTEYRLLSLTKQGVIVRDISNAKGKFSSDMGSSQEVREGDFVFCLFDVPETPRTVGLSSHAGMITSAYTVFEHSGRGNPQYFEKYYIAMDDHKLLSPLYSGLRHTIPVDRFLGTKTPQPPPEEQSAIVRFLASVDRRVNRLVRAKRRLIELLTEQKQALITHAVTRGLNPNAKLKPSGIDWLGDVPEHWETKQIKQLLNRIDYGTSTQAKTEGPVRILTMGNIQGGEVTLDPCGRLDLDAIPPSLLLHHHDLLFTRTNGNPDLVGKVGLFRGTLEDQVSFASYLVRLRVSPPNDARWLHLLVNSRAFWPYARSFALVNLQTNLNASRYVGFSIPVPPPEEQAVIASKVSISTKSLDSACETAHREIDLLREYRTRLVADVVTGKLDVRDAARNLPDDDTELAEPLDPMEDDFTESDDFGEESTEEVAVGEDA